MEHLIQIALISLGGVLGVNARHWLGLEIAHRLGIWFPWPTFLINVTGSLAIGFISVALSRWLPNPHYRLLLVTGFLGGYTTYSSFALESFNLWQRGDRGLGLAYALGTLVAGLLAVTLGAVLAASLPSPSLPVPVTAEMLEDDT